MKFSSAFLTLVGSVSVVNGATLRVADFSARHLDTKVALKGVRGEPSVEDMEIIGKALVASYNDVHWQAGHFLTGSYETEPVGWSCTRCPDDDSASANKEFTIAVKTPLRWSCTRCPDDDAQDAASMLATALTNECGGMCNKDATAELETTFCNKIRASGSAYLKSASHCNIQFEQQDNKKSSSMMLKKSHAPVVSESLATIDTTLILKGVNGAATSKEELAVIAKAYVSAYNDVHWDAGHYMADAEIPFVAGTPLEWSCTRCPDDDSARTGANTLVLDLVTPVIQWSCTRCPDDDAAEYVADLESNELTKKAVEVAFCNKLQASISDKLRATQLCSIAMETIVTSNNMGKVSA